MVSSNCFYFVYYSEEDTQFFERGGCIGYGYFILGHFILGHIVCSAWTKHLLTKILVDKSPGKGGQNTGHLWG